jgi:hypothetical protein
MQRETGFRFVTGRILDFLLSKKEGIIELIKVSPSGATAKAIPGQEFKNRHSQNWQEFCWF